MRADASVCAAMAGPDVTATSGRGWCISSFLTGQKTPLDSTGNDKLLIFSVPQKKLVISHCVVCHSVWLFIDAGHK